MTQLSLQVPKRFHPSIIGKGGATIQQLQSSHGVSIHVPARDSPSSTVMITGEDNNIYQVKAEIERILGFSVSDQPLHTATLSLSTRHYGTLIGPSGSTLKQLEQETGCSITVPPRDSPGQVEVQGSQAGIQNLQSKLAQMTGETIQANYSSAQATQHQSSQPVAQSATNNRGSGSSNNSGFGGLFSTITSIIQNVNLDDITGKTSNRSSTTTAPASNPATVSRQSSIAMNKVPLNNISEVLFFPESAGHVGHFDRFLQLLKSATESIDVAIYTLSDDRISRSLMTMHEQGIKIRVFTEEKNMNDLGSDIQQLANVGIPTKVDSTDFLMHLKVAIIDRTCVLSGSFNWTRSASEGNTENVICTSDRALVAAFVKQFEQMWPTGKIVNKG